MKFDKSILCIGAGHVGGPTMAVIAHKCPHYKVTVVDIDPERVAEWNSDELPIFEPGLDEIVKHTRNRNLFFSTNIPEGIRDSEIIFVSVNTPTKDYGLGAGQAADLQNWERTARQILRHSHSDKIIVEKSTVPVKTAQAMQRILSSGANGCRFHVLSNPEFLAEGTAVEDLLFPDRVLVGSTTDECGLRSRNELVTIYANWVPRERIITTDLWSSELSKLVANAFLAQRISSINSISALCEKTGANISDVALAVGMDGRIGNRFLSASVGFGGSCFKKDILNLVYLCRHYGLHEVADYWQHVVAINQWQQERFVFNMLSTMFNTLSGKKICLFGFAFKANTGDTRESPALFVTKKLLEENAQIVITDPKALRNAKFDLKNENGLIGYEEDPYRAVNGCDAIAVMTEWEIYRDLDYREIYRSMTKPAFIFDGRNILDHQALFEVGFNVFPIGRPPLRHF